MTRAYPHPTPATETEAPFGVLLCTGCDAIRDTERAYCDGCGEATGSYAFRGEDDGQVTRVNGSGGYLGVMRFPVSKTAFTRLVPHDGLGFLVADAA